VFLVTAHLLLHHNNGLFMWTWSWKGT